ncbi:MAG TPA: response regulator [Candidatus Dormibacteraeota bacterium]
MVLVVDDDPSTRFVLRMILETAGHLVTEAENGEAALARMGPRPDVVMTDLMMPVLGGKELIERLRSQPTTASIRIVVVSGSPAEARALHAAGLIEAFVIKPFDAMDLLKCIGGVAGKLSAVGAEALAS